ncbi:L-2-hydroxyglutarate oxidase [Fulvivirga lutimaris]|uniref:L-2-hydroxyglutarate oxidase n=1 Tax=Fulvivirga lutimaris TaxID=1819566 RepID=UPI0012BC0546|nr:L-2-hydroxyglutarate oxidase [Fulvivirga lutimaris]MTI40780.1 L-2-hydroxyglutarate oxidase [Fulvivirga lutimaris]
MKYDIIIIGAGIVGLATALKTLEKRPESKILILDKEDDVAKHQTGNNSGVIHSGLYYKPGSLKATNCINGYRQMVEFCTEYDIPFELCGKIVVATSKEEIPLLNNLTERGKQNGLDNLKPLEAEELKEYEPHVAGVKGLFVPQTGIVDYTLVSKKYAELIKSKGGTIQLGEKVLNIKTGKGRSTVVTSKGTYETKLIVNCAGLYSDKVARFTNQKLDVKIIPFRGEYYKLTKEKESLVKNLIYPVPDPNFPFLGVHFTRMAKGGVEAGPNAVLAFKREGYKKSDINLSELTESLLWPGFQKVAMKYWKTGFGEMYRSFSKAAFTKALQKLLPEVTEKDLAPGGAGVRAQACDRNGGLIDDFLILENEFAINVCNAPSPAATSSLSIGDHVSDLIMKHF